MCTTVVTIFGIILAIAFLQIERTLAEDEIGLDIDIPAIVPASRNKLSSYIIRQLELWQMYKGNEGIRSAFSHKTREGNKCVQREEDDHCTIASIELFKNIFNMWHCDAVENVCRCGRDLDEDSEYREWDADSSNCLIPAGKICHYGSEHKKFEGKCVPGHICAVDLKNPKTEGMICQSATKLPILSWLTFIIITIVQFKPWSEL